MTRLHVLFPDGFGHQCSLYFIPLSCIGALLRCRAVNPAISNHFEVAGVQDVPVTVF